MRDDDVLGSAALSHQWRSSHKRCGNPMNSSSQRDLSRLAEGRILAMITRDKTERRENNIIDEAMEIYMTVIDGSGWYNFVIFWEDRLFVLLFDGVSVDCCRWIGIFSVNCCRLILLFTEAYQSIAEWMHFFLKNNSFTSNFFFVLSMGCDEQGACLIIYVLVCSNIRNNVWTHKRESALS